MKAVGLGRFPLTYPLHTVTMRAKSILRRKEMVG